MLKSIFRFYFHSDWFRIYQSECETKRIKKRERDRKRKEQQKNAGNCKE